MTAEDKRLARNARDREWRKNNPDKVREYKKRDYAARKESIKDYAIKWRRDNPDCRKEEHKKRYAKAEFREKALAASTEWAKQHPDRVAAIQAKYYENNRDKRILNSFKWKEANKDKRQAYYKSNRDRILVSNKAWKKANPDRLVAMCARRRSLKLMALDESSNDLLISVFYEVAQRVTKCLGIEHHVDHIIPLTRKGKHHQCNLQVIPGVINLRKNNKLDFQVFTKN